MHASESVTAVAAPRAWRWVGPCVAVVIGVALSWLGPGMALISCALALLAGFAKSGTA